MSIATTVPSGRIIPMSCGTSEPEVSKAIIPAPPGLVAPAGRGAASAAATTAMPKMTGQGLTTLLSDANVAPVVAR